MVKDAANAVLADAATFADCAVVTWTLDWFLCESTPATVELVEVEGIGSRFSITGREVEVEIKLLLEEEISGGRSKIREEAGTVGHTMGIEFDLSTTAEISK